MDYFHFYDNRERRVNHLISRMAFRSKLLFGAFCLQRNAANYYHFAVKEKLIDPYFLYRINIAVWDLASKAIANVKDPIANALLNEFYKEDNLPNSEEHKDATWAINAYSIAFDVVKYYVDGEDNRILRISLTSMDTVEKWIYENYGYINELDQDFDTKITSYELMEDEIMEQDFVLEVLKKNKSSYLEIKKRADARNLSNIGLFVPKLG